MDLSMHGLVTYLLVDDPYDTFCAGWNGEGANVLVVVLAAHLYVPGIDHSHRSLDLQVDHRSDMPHQLSITSLIQIS